MADELKQISFKEEGPLRDYFDHFKSVYKKTGKVPGAYGFFDKKFKRDMSRAERAKIEKFLKSVLNISDESIEHHLNGSRLLPPKYVGSDDAKPTPTPKPGNVFDDYREYEKEVFGEEDEKKRKKKTDLGEKASKAFK